MGRVDSVSVLKRPGRSRSSSPARPRSCYVTSDYLSLISAIVAVSCGLGRKGQSFRHSLRPSDISAFRSAELVDSLYELLPLLCECEVAGSSFLWM